MRSCRGAFPVRLRTRACAGKQIQFCRTLRFLIAASLLALRTQSACADSAVAWGLNAFGQVGNGTTTDSNAPVVVKGLSSGVSFAIGGEYHSLAVKDSGVYAWGYNAFGQLGDGTTTNRLTPVAIGGLSSAATIAAGGYHNLALQNGGVYAWGWNVYGQLGDGTTTDRHTPVAVNGLTSGVTAVVGGVDHSLAV